MATVSIYYDQRYKSASGKYPLYYRVNLPRRKNFVINTKMHRLMKRGKLRQIYLDIQKTKGKRNWFKNNSYIWALNY